MRVCKLAVWPIVFIVIAACSNQVTDVKLEAKEALLAFGAAINTGDIEVAVAFYDTDPDFHWIERGGVQYENGAAAAASLNELLASGRKSVISYDDIRVADLSPTSALVSAHFYMTIRQSEEAVPFSFDGWTSIAMVKREGRWFFAAGQAGPGRPQSSQ